MRFFYLTWGCDIQVPSGDDEDHDDEQHDDDEDDDDDDDDVDDDDES